MQEVLKLHTTATNLFTKQQINLTDAITLAPMSATVLVIE
ncbi:cyclomaltodextrinase C-terminal domain-containing protein [Pseudoalteromonas sp. 2-MNA-CIBAN-0060]